jgi:hypothetical protein
MKKRNFNYFKDKQIKELEKQYQETKMLNYIHTESKLRKKKVENQNIAQVETDYNALRRHIEQKFHLGYINADFLVKRKNDLEKLVQKTLY